MYRLALRRLIYAIPTLLLVSFVVFLLFEAVGDPAASLAGPNPTPELLAQIREQLHLDQPLPVRYAQWLFAALHGDFGKSFSNGAAVGPLIFSRLGVTVSLIVVAMILTITIGGILGVVASLKPGRFWDRAVATVSASAIAVPPFWLGMLLVLAFALYLPLLPALGYVDLAQSPLEWLRHIILPSIALAAYGIGTTALQLKVSLSDTLRQDFIMASRAKGLPPHSLVLKHGLKNAAVPVVTMLGLRLAQLVGGTVVVEQVFNLPGLGQLALTSTIDRDVPVMLGIVVLSTLMITLINVCVDISYAYFNPKVRT
ncbi:ABC transporter permease [Microbacterium sp. X-17]|uniref:ABC transporter permease n=1 Tax=Microbacterium sp. X-17 TaxID=3144404 RepID=UPI0031F568C6